jgi:hypothetical protein
MKKLFLGMLTVVMLSTFIPVQLNAGTKSLPATNKTVESEEAKAILSRLNEIKAMDKSKLTPSEKKVLRKEVRESKERMQSMGGGIYLSLGAIIIIVLLLIILL